MTSRERIEAALRHQEPDRTPIFEYVLQPPVADAVLGRAYVYGERFDPFVREHGWEKAVRRQAGDMVDLAKSLGHDMLYVVPNPLPPHPVEKQEPPPPAPVFDDDPVAEMESRLRITESRDVTPNDDNFLIYRAVKEAMRQRDLDLPILAPAYGHGVWTDTVLMQTMVLEPALAARHFAACTRSILPLVEKYHSLGVEMAGVGGDFAGTRGPMVSPKAYHDLMVPEVRKVSRHAHTLGMVTVNASDGNLWSVIEDFLTGCDVDGYIEIDFFAGMRVGELKLRFGKKVTFFGNLDCGNMLSFGSPDDVRRHTTGILTEGRGHGGHILCASNAITASIPLENYLAVYTAYREFFGLPRD